MMMMESVKDDDGTFRLPHSHSHILTLTLTHSGQGQARPQVIALGKNRVIFHLSTFIRV